MDETHKYICCHECDEIVKIPHPHKKGRYKCPNCNHTLFKYWPDMVEKLYAISITSFILLIITNTFPFLSFEIMGNRTEINFFTSAYYLYQNQNFILAVTVLMTTIIVPTIWIFSTILIFGSIYHRHITKSIKLLLKLHYSVSPWGMLDVFLIGVLVSIVKLAKMGTMVTGTAMWSFVGLVLLITYMQSIYDPHTVWELVEKGIDNERD